MSSRRDQAGDFTDRSTPLNREAIKALQTKVRIESLPVTRAFLSQKRLVEDRGELALIEDGLTIHHLGYFSLVPGRGFRGGHSHGRKTEHFYVVSGVLLLDLVDVEKDLGVTVRLEVGHKVVIRPGCAHRFAAEETAQVIEYYEGTYEKDDDLPYGFGEDPLPGINAGILGREANEE